MDIKAVCRAEVGEPLWCVVKLVRVSTNELYWLADCFYLFQDQREMPQNLPYLGRTMRASPLLVKNYEFYLKFEPSDLDRPLFSERYNLTKLTGADE